MCISEIFSFPDRRVGRPFQTWTNGFNVCQVGFQQRDVTHCLSI